MIIIKDYEGVVKKGKQKKEKENRDLGIGVGLVLGDDDDRWVTTWIAFSMLFLFSMAIFLQVGMYVSTAPNPGRSFPRSPNVGRLSFRCIRPLANA